MFETSKDSILNRRKDALVEDRSRQSLLFYIINIVLSAIAFVVTVVNFFAEEYIFMAEALVFCALFVLNLFFMMYSKFNKKIVFYIFEAELMILLVHMFISGVYDGFSVLWTCLIPGLAILVFGIRNGGFFSAAVFAMIVFLFWIPAGRSLLMYSYSGTFMVEFPFLYCLIFIVSLMGEIVRKETRIQLERSKEEYAHLYCIDPLTGLNNRFGIEDFMNEALSGKSEERVAVIMMDVDGFKNVNDTYGHECGDEVLKMIASILGRVICEHSRYCRWGGEEFLIVMRCGHDPVETGERIRREIEAAYIMYNGKKVQVTVSVGLCILKGASDVTNHDVVDMADQAMYSSKNRGKNRVTAFSVDEKGRCESEVML